MIVQKNKKEVTIAIKEGRIVALANIFRLLGDNILETIDKKFNITSMLHNDFIEKRKKNIVIRKEVFLISAISLAFKTLTAVRDMPIAITSVHMLDKLKINIIKDKNDKERPLLLENNIRNFINNYTPKNLINSFNRHINNLMNKAVETPAKHILDCTVLEVNLNNENYEKSSIVKDKDGVVKRGYKLAMLRGILPTGGIIEEVNIDSINKHDLKVSESILLKSKHLKSGDLLLQDRGFIDLEIFRNLTSRGINIIMPARKDMDLYKACLAEAISADVWQKHPNKKRKGQDIAFVTNLEEFWITENERLKKPGNEKFGYTINCAVVRFDKADNKVLETNKNTENILMDDERYAYSVFMCNNPKLTAAQIIREYELRPEIEEDNRQLKEFWNLEGFRSTKYNFIVFYIISVLMAYNYYQIFKNLEEGKEYEKISLPVMIEKQRLQRTVSIKDTHIFAATEKYFAVYGQFEFMDIYAECTLDVRKKIKQLSFDFGDL